MGYTHYWRRKKDIDSSTFQKIVDDFKKVLPKVVEYGVKLADGLGEGEPEINYDIIRFNGAVHCGHPENAEIITPWPSDDTGGIANPEESVKVDNWYAGAMIQKRCCDGDCSYETFEFERELTPYDWDEPEDGKYFRFCKTAFRPYDLAVISFLIIAKKHLKERIIISSDGKDNLWFDGKFLCHLELGYGLDFSLGEEDGLRNVLLKSEAEDGYE